eukprot:CAMPEP_0116898208 /NCGR_PEP_ID=MMETSP0467-20121206/6971_1 /TAXON_ID=283647 /ORGANISM="Mesodinium pulex, Strain SPMC105" /LENGTH=38 /DNA_ID= /DNA_START= /DNA_END= /DNA_ORIENTATION=
MITSVYAKTVTAAADKAFTLTLWDVIKLVMMIIQIKLM